MPQDLCNFGGARVRRQIDPSGSIVPEHAHDWPLLSLFVLGGYRNGTELGQVDIDRPSAVLYAAGAAHANAVGPEGFEQVEIAFDPKWLKMDAGALPPVRRWTTGPAAVIGTLANLCRRTPTEAALRTAVRDFIAREPAQQTRTAPAWVEQVDRLARRRLTWPIAELARQVGRHPAWLGSSYPRHTGEGLQQARARFRVERAATLLRETSEPQAQIAASAGFCDQSHMVRVFNRLLGRTPSQVRADASFLGRQAG